MTPYSNSARGEDYVVTGPNGLRISVTMNGPDPTYRQTADYGSGWYFWAASGTFPNPRLERTQPKPARRKTEPKRMWRP